MSKREEAFDEWEEMRREAKRRQREDRRLNIFWRKNKCFPKQFGGDDETPDAQETLMFWRSINNKDVSEGWLSDESIQEVLREMRGALRGRCRWEALTEEEFDDVLRCTARGRHAGSTQYTPSPSRSARQSRRRCSSW